MTYINIESKISSVRAGSRLVQTLYRDETELAKVNVSAERTLAFSNKLADLDALPNDEVLVDKIIVKTLSKDALRKSIYENIRAWYLALEGLGKNHDLYKRLFIPYIYRVDDLLFAKKVQILIQLVRENATELEAELIDISKVDAWESDRKLYLDLFANRSLLIANRKLAKQTRDELTDWVLAELRKTACITQAVFLMIRIKKSKVESIKYFC